MMTVKDVLHVLFLYYSDFDTLYQPSAGDRRSRRLVDHSPSNVELGAFKKFIG